MPERHKRNPNTACIICSEEIYRRPCELERNKGNVFCSNKCFGIACRRETSCLVCGTPILASLHKKTCSRSCANIHRAGIKYKLNRPKDKVKAQQAVKYRLLRERGQGCERCGYRTYTILQVHHKDRNRENNQLNNLELLCPNCHYVEHFLSGKGKKFSLKISTK